MTPSHPTWQAILPIAGIVTLLLLTSVVSVVGGR